MSQEEIVVPKGWELKKLGDPDVSEIIMVNLLQVLHITQNKMDYLSFKVRKILAINFLRLEHGVINQKKLPKKEIF